MQIQTMKAGVKVSDGRACITRPSGRKFYFWPKGAPLHLFWLGQFNLKVLLPLARRFNY